MSVHRHPSSNEFGSGNLNLGDAVSRLKEHKYGRIKEALHHYSLTKQAIDDVRKRERDLCKERDSWFQAVKDAMGNNERLVIGDLLITRHPNGGLQIETVQVVGLL